MLLDTWICAVLQFFELIFGEISDVIIYNLVVFFLVS